VTGFLATGLTLPEESLAEMCRCATRYMARGEGAACLGVHLEGPFFNGEMAGAQNKAYLRLPDAGMVMRLNALCPVKKVSLAPELEGAEPCIRALSAAGIVSSGGHSSADYDTFERARAAGMTHLTHFCNAMIPIHHLRPSMVTGGMLADDVLVEIITDGVHLSDPMIRLIAKAKGPDRVMVITDAIAAAGCPDGLYTLGGLRVRVADGCARLADVPYDPKAIVSNVAGSVSLFCDCFRRFARVTGWPLEEAVKAAGFNQLRSLGIMDRGEISPGQVADLVLVDADLRPQKTIVGGGVRFERE
jgi:N-acetylglucosamine-6-phosphate deacetylase